MEHYIEENEQDEISKNVFLSEEDAAEKLGLTERQKRYADFRVAGLNQTRSAEEAGYSGTGSSLRSTASMTEASEKVQAYIAWKRSGQAGVPDDPATREEIKRVLSRIVRNEKDRSSQIRAAEALNRIHAVEAEREREIGDPVEALNKIAEGPWGVVLALLLANHYRLPYKPPRGIPVPSEADLRSLLDPIRWANGEAHPGASARSDDPPPPATPGERAKHKFIEGLNSDPGARDTRPRRTGEARPSQEGHLLSHPAAGVAVSDARPAEQPETWLSGGAPARYEGALTREQAERFVQNRRPR